MAYWFLGVKLLPGTHYLFLGIGRIFPGTPKLFLGAFWLLGTTPPFLGTLERFLGMPKIRTNKFLFLQPPTRTAPTPASSISRRARRSTRDILPWAAYTCHTPSNKVLHKTRCAKDRGRSKDTFGTTLAMESYTRTTGTSN
jgi:hypothetical protein